MKNLDIFAGIFKVYHRETALISNFIRQWQMFASEIEECIADITSKEDKDLPPKIQSFVAQTTSN